MTDQEWTGTRQRVEALGASPMSSEVFGALGHKWALEEPLSHADEVDLAPRLNNDGTPVTFARWYTDWLRQPERATAGSYGP